MDARAYLDRIGYDGPLAPTAETLRALHRRHLLTVPFENLDIGLGRPILLDPDHFIDKVVRQRRGGFCYELNGAFVALLTALGFRVTLLSARVVDDQGVASQEFDHLTLRVDLDEPWLADVGFGDNFLEPLRLAPEIEQHDPVAAFRLIDGGSRWRMERRDREGPWRLRYDFTLQPRQLSEFAGMCHYHQTSPESHFTRNRICSLATANGRVTLSGLRLIVTADGTREERELGSEAEWGRELEGRFGVVF